MKEKREKMIRDYLYEEESNKTLTAKDIVSRIDFSTPQVKPQVRRKKKSKLKVALVCLSYILIAFFTSIAFFNSANNGKINDLYEGNLIDDDYILDSSYYIDDELISIIYKDSNSSKEFYILRRLEEDNCLCVISYNSKEINVNPNEITYFATLKENEELEFDILYNGEQRHCIIQNLN